MRPTFGGNSNRQPMKTEDGRDIAESVGKSERLEEGVHYGYQVVVDWLDGVATDEDRDTRGIVDDGLLGIGTFFERLSKLGCWVLVKEVFVNCCASAQTVHYFERYEDIPEAYRAAAEK